MDWSFFSCWYCKECLFNSAFCHETLRYPYIYYCQFWLEVQTAYGDFQNIAFWGSIRQYMDSNFELHFDWILEDLSSPTCGWWSWIPRNPISLTVVTCSYTATASFLFHTKLCVIWRLSLGASLHSKTSSVWTKKINVPVYLWRHGTPGVCQARSSTNTIDHISV